MKFLLPIFLLLSISSFAQDIIIKKNGDEIKAKVNEITKTEIKYKKFENIEGPTYQIDISEVFMIRYENGSKDVFNTSEQKNTELLKETTNSKLFIIPKSNDIAKATPFGNKYVFINSEPIAKYEVVFTFVNTMGTSTLTNINLISDNSIKNANKEAALQGKLYDAVIIREGTDRDVAIKFLISTDDFSICRANKISGITAFVGCEPYYKYQTTGSMFQIHEVGTNPIFGDYNATFSFYINKAIAWVVEKV